MPHFEVIILGTGDAFSEERTPTALLLVYGGFSLAVDCPDSYRKVLRETATKADRALSLEGVDHLLLTHVHGDHMNGIESVAFYKHLVERKRLTLVASSEVRSVIWEQRLRASMGTLWDGEVLREKRFEDYFDFRPLSWSDSTTVGPFRIRARPTRHHVPTSALLVEAGGRVLGYSSDAAFDAELLDFLAPADLILHETNLGPAHSPLSALEALPEGIRERMVLVHYPDGLAESGTSIRLAHQGDVLRP
ncbi:MAG: ribonuclease Z [Deltaproteobacteria bacterium]|nr:ribonuclease Z [Deltaproteobacteria bacterium]